MDCILHSGANSTLTSPDNTKGCSTTRPRGIKIATYVIIMLAILLFGSTAKAQLIVNEDTIKAKFGIDGDMYSGKFQFPVNVHPQDSAGTDDWFQGAVRSGAGVIDPVAPPWVLAALHQNLTNF